MDLVEDHRYKLTTGELTELQCEQIKGMLEEHSGEKEEEVVDVSSAEIKEIYSGWNKVQGFIKKHHLNITMPGRAVDISNVNVVPFLENYLAKKKTNFSGLFSCVNTSH